MAFVCVETHTAHKMTDQIDLSAATFWTFGARTEMVLFSMILNKKKKPFSKH